MKEKEWKKWIFWFTFAVAAIAVYKTIDSVSVVFSEIKNLLSLLMPFIMAVIIAYILYIPCKSVEKTYSNTKLKFISKHARGLSIATIYLIFLLLIFITINFIIPTLSSSFTDLASNLPNYYNSAIEFFENAPEDSIWVKLNIAELILNLQELNFIEEISNWFNLGNINQYIRGLMGVTRFIFNLFITIVVSIYMLLERTSIRCFVKRLSKALFNDKTYNKLSKYYNKINNIFFNFVGGQILDAIIVGIISSVAMIIMKVKYGTLLGLLIGVFNIIPYFGAIVAVTISVIITIFTGGFVKAIWLAIIVIILQQIDANIINPRILGNSLNLSPILIIFAVTVGGAYFGVLGMFLGVPVVALIKVILEDFILEQQAIKEKKNL